MVGMASIDQVRAAQAAAMSEREFTGLVRKVAKETGWLCYHTHRSERSEPGYPDFTLVKGDRLLFRELKTAKGRVTPAQLQWLDALAGAGIDVGVWRPIDMTSGLIYRVLAGVEDDPNRMAVAGH
jgi:hypothetical protein